MRLAANYFSPSEYYESILARLVTPATRWLDVGGGRQPLPGNVRLARALSDRCECLVGLDPDETLHENVFVHEKVQQSLYDFHTESPFDLITLRMVAEHVTEPARAAEVLQRVSKPGAKLVIFTVSRWSLSSIAAAMTPHQLHHKAKKYLWKTEAKDTFPVQYLMNTRKRLASVLGRAGFRELLFRGLADACVLWRFRRFHALELSAWKLASALGVKYPESCLLGVYERTSS
jgi:2-polyprenyl-3-methyl-5-hydroxy-6-metoxy-1,4-benzoquinol methylase